MDNIEKIKVDESVQRVADAISSYLNEKQNVKLDEWTVSDVEIAMKKKYGKVDKTAIEKLKKVQHRGNVDRNDLVKVGHGKLNVESIEIDEAKEKKTWVVYNHDSGKLEKEFSNKISADRHMDKLNKKYEASGKLPYRVMQTEETELDEAKPEYEVKYAKRKSGPIKVTKFMTLDQAKEFLAKVKKDGMNGIISKGGKPVKEEAEINEGAVYSIKNTKTGQTYSISKYKDDKKLDKIRKAGDDHKYAAQYKDGKLIEEVELDEAKKQGLKLQCQECGKVFTKKIGPKTVEVQCPKCKGFDVDVAKEEVELDEKTKWKMGDGRPRGGAYIENERFWDLPKDSLEYIIKDAGEAIKANPKARKATTGRGNWADQINDAASVLGWRKKNGIKEEAELDEVRQLKDPKKEVMVVKNKKVIVIDKKDAKEYLNKGWELAEEQEAELDEAKYEKHGEYDGKVVKISKKEFAKVSKDYKNTTKGKERMMVLDPKTKGSISVPVQFEEETNESVQRVANALSHYEARKLSPSARAKRDALRDISRGKSKDDDDEIKSTKADRERADRNIINKLKKSADVKGNYEIKFDKGPAKKVPYKLVKFALDKNEKMKTTDKLKFQNELTKSYKDFLKALKDM